MTQNPTPPQHPPGSDSAADTLHDHIQTLDTLFRYYARSAQGPDPRFDLFDIQIALRVETQYRNSLMALNRLKNTDSQTAEGKDTA